jgi:hypothetical protein
MGDITFLYEMKARITKTKTCVGMLRNENKSEADLYYMVSARMVRTYLCEWYVIRK